jgi:hypothetical protein
MLRVVERVVTTDRLELFIEYRHDSGDRRAPDPRCQVRIEGESIAFVSPASPDRLDCDCEVHEPSRFDVGVETAGVGCGPLRLSAHAVHRTAHFVHFEVNEIPG